MKRKGARPRPSPSPNEEAQLIREESERRRKLRIQQVREQERYIALQIRKDVQRRRDLALQNLAEELREDWEQQQREKVETLQRLYQESLQFIGQGHRSAKENEPDWTAIAQREVENQTKAEERYREALKELKSQKKKGHEEQSRSLTARKKALQTEKERAAKVASLPPPPPNPIESLEFTKHVVRKSHVNALSETHYNMPDAAVDREARVPQPDAHKVAELEAQRLQELGKEVQRQREEQLEKARLRGRHALKREQLMQDRERFLVQLEHMQQTDLLRRRLQVSQMPAQIFQPLYKRQEIREDGQREMEFAFEDMYTCERRLKGDLVLQLVPEPLPAPSTGSQDQEVDQEMDDDNGCLDVTPVAEHGQHDESKESGGTVEETSPQVGPSRPAPRQALKKLLNKIRSQRGQRSSHGNHIPTAEPPVAITDDTVERDTTIDTGSLSSEGRMGPPTTIPKLAKSPLAFETTDEESVVAGPAPPPGGVSNHILEFELERKRREEELETKKRQQLVLLQELEEQKSQLEHLLLEAQQERECLSAAAAQEVAVTAPAPGPAAQPIPVIDDPRRRIREYQQRLLEQNRIHKRSVEVARQRLEEYQRAIQIRYNMTAHTTLPPAVPPAHIPPPLHSTKDAVRPLQPPICSVVPSHVPRAHAEAAVLDISKREPAILATPPPLSGPFRHQKHSFGIDSSSVSMQQESSAESPPHQGTGTTAWLTHSIMEKVTKHFPDRLKHPLGPLHSFAADQAPVPPAADPIRTVSPSTAMGLEQGSVQPQAFLQVDPQLGSLASRETDLGRQRRTLQEAQRWMLEQREVMEKERQKRGEQERWQHEEQERRKWEEEQRWKWEEERRRQQQEEERQKWEEEERLKQEEQRCMQEKRWLWEEEQRQKGEERLKREEERDHMRRQREALQGLIDADTLAPETEDGAFSEDIGQVRLRLLSSLLRAIEDSHGGTLSHLEQEHQQPSTSTPTSSSVPLAPPAPWSGLHPTHPASKPPVARVKLVTGQHELSAILEVETPLNGSLLTGLEDDVSTLPHAVTRFQLEEPGSPEVSGGGTSSLSEGSRGKRPEPSQTGPEVPGSGGGASPYSAISSCRSPTESAHRRADSDCLSSTPISTGSYVTTDPEQNWAHTEATPPPARLCVEGLVSPAASPPSAQSSCSVERSPSALSMDSLFSDSKIQRIIDKYTRELNISLSSTAKSMASCADGEGSSVQQSPASVQGRAAGSRSVISDSESTPQERSQEWDNTVNQFLERFSEPVSLVQDQDSSFTPLIAQAAELSSCLAADQSDLTAGLLVGQPSMESSAIDPPPGPTLSCTIGRPSHQTGARGLCAGRLLRQGDAEQSSEWLTEGHEEQMRPLTGELDESGFHRSVSSGACDSVGLGGSAQEPKASDSTPDPGLNPEEETMQSTTGPVHQDTESSGVFTAQDSFYPLQVEVTHNETVDTSMTFHPPEQEVPGSTGSDEDAASSEFPEESNASPERLRAEEASRCPDAAAALQDFLCQVTVFQSPPRRSVLVVSPTPQEAELACVSLSRLSLREASVLGSLPAEAGDQEEKSVWSQNKDANVQPCANQWLSAAPWDHVMAHADEKGILEQSEITLVSLTDSTLLDQDATDTEYQEGKPEEELEQLPEDNPTSMEEKPEPQGDPPPPCPVTLMEFEWSPGGGLQEAFQTRRRLLHQRSAHRVAEIRARRVPPESRAQPKAKTQHPKRSSKAGVQDKNTPPAPVSDGVKKSGEVRTCSVEQRKLNVSEMHQRTQRLYGRLEEVKHQKEVKSRQEASAQNRLKAREFHKKTLQKLRGKRTSR